MDSGIRKSAKGQGTAYLEMGVWYDAKSGHIRLSVPKSDWFITTVCNDPKSKRCHANLYGKLARALKEAGMPAPEAPDAAD